MAFAVRLYPPLDPTPLPPHPEVFEFNVLTSDGLYVYARSDFGRLLGLPDGPHRHPRIPGGGRSAMYAGDVEIEGGQVVELTNLSGTFRCDSRSGLLDVAEAFCAVGLRVLPGAIRFFPSDGSPPVTLSLGE